MARHPEPSPRDDTMREPISPELALVDDALRMANASAGPASWESRRPPRPAASFAARTDAPRGRVPERGLLPLAVGALLVAWSALAPLQPAGGDAPSDPRAAVASAPERSTRSTPVPLERRSLELGWQASRGAVFYNVILWRDGKRVLDLWPRRPELSLAGRRLTPGTYRWFVYPALADARGRRYGSLVASGIVKI
jgi:hypothetical protein